jgi:hypothetical protein
VSQTLDPIIDPPVRILFQWNGAWALQPLRPKNMRNGCFSPLETKRSTGDPNNWADNGCYPVSFTMAVRWWSEDFPTTKGNVSFPTTYPSTQATLDPLELCRRFTGDVYFPCGLDSKHPLAPRCPQPLPSNTQPRGANATTLPATCNTLFSLQNADGTCGGCGTDLSQLDAASNTRAGYNTYAVGEVAPFAKQLSFEGNNMTYERWRCSGMSGNDKAAKLKAWLAFGPIMVLMIPPGHWVLVTGYRNGTIYMCDPGAVICGSKWLKQANQRVADGADTGGQGYVSVADTWLTIVQAMDKVTFPTATGEGENASWFQPIAGIS